MSDRRRALLLRRRRLLALAVLLSSSIAFLRVAFWTDDADEDGMLRVAYAIAVLMVLGTLGFGLALWQLRCPRCGYHYGSDVAGGVQILGHSFVDAIVALVRRFRCPSCGFDERRALESDDILTERRGGTPGAARADRRPAPEQRRGPSRTAPAPAQSGDLPPE